jgi:polyisoprenoid-binding protein YceI
MIKSIIIVAFIILCGNMALAQKYLTKTGTITFFSEAPLENIQAVNNKVTCALNTQTGAMEFAVLMKAFEFKKALMQEHFNENYVESDKYPKATFKGKIENLSTINFTKDFTYDAIISGELTIHGVTQNVKTKGTFTMSSGKIKGNATFTILLSDYKIAIPSAVKQKISNEVKIVVDINMEPSSAN